MTRLLEPPLPAPNSRLPSPASRLPPLASGGARLRALRETAGLTQLRVETEADLGTGYLQRLESGKVAQPARPTLDRILDALAASYTDRRDLLDRFGYTLAIAPPTASERARARESIAADLAAAPFPAYVLDCTHRLVAWNRFLPRLLDLDPGDPLLHRWSHDSFLAAWFDAASPLAAAVADPAELLPALIRAFRYEMRHVEREPWAAEVLARLLALPRFRQTWEIVIAEPRPASAARSLVPVRLLTPAAGPLQFRLSAEPFLQDDRFRALSLFPADPTTIHVCASHAS